MSEKKLPQKLKELRKVNNYTQDYVAAVLGIVRQTYSHYETGRRTPDAEALYKLAGLYNISIDDLMHLTVDIDREVSYDAPVPSQSSEDLSEFLEFFNDPANKKKYMFHTNLEKELLFYFLAKILMYCTPHCISISCIIADISPVVARISTLSVRDAMPLIGIL